MEGGLHNDKLQRTYKPSQDGSGIPIRYKFDLSTVGHHVLIFNTTKIIDISND